MSSTPVDANSFLQYSQEYLITGTSSTVLSQQVATSGGVRPLCEICGQSFGRLQELRRHNSDKHMPPRKCPFCSHEWTRPDRIKTHITDVHRGEFSAEVLQGICSLRGQAVFNFFDTDFIRTALIRSRSGSSVAMSGDGNSGVRCGIARKDSDAQVEWLSQKLLVYFLGIPNQPVSGDPVICSGALETPTQPFERETER
ncbi:hypothetical protein H4582DRAFT_2160047 [Lactarius indigo]|nr:hypothetical protein H4582DRAFT_2160047 [Lactarius indigo]